MVETPSEMFHRIAANLAMAEAQFGGDVDTTEERFYKAISNLDFLSNSPTLMNAGTEIQQLAACFVLCRTSPRAARRSDGPEPRGWAAVEAIQYRRIRIRRLRNHQFSGSTGITDIPV
ncbi:ribonucleotide reductase N-terminal alpha domain-containing protein (plasmid) [Haloferax sp. S1W]|uniref:ribonucleotide reductase N-terminal alpha domain-containing protein n=1 Tax=Haloferax sp. S1W TaxID=3377110 RepID=UPI0037CAE660